MRLECDQIHFVRNAPAKRWYLDSLVVGVFWKRNHNSWLHIISLIWCCITVTLSCYSKLKESKRKLKIPNEFKIESPLVEMLSARRGQHIYILMFSNLFNRIANVFNEQEKLNVYFKKCIYLHFITELKLRKTDVMCKVTGNMNNTYTYDVLTLEVKDLTGYNWNNFWHYRILGTGIGSNVNSSQPYSVHSTYNMCRINVFVIRPIHTSTTCKCKCRIGSYRYWFVLLQYFRLVHNLNWWRFLCKHRKGGLGFWICFFILWHYFQYTSSELWGTMKTLWKLIFHWYLLETGKSTLKLI